MRRSGGHLPGLIEPGLQFGQRGVGSQYECDDADDGGNSPRPGAARVTQHRLYELRALWTDQVADLTDYFPRAAASPKKKPAMAIDRVSTGASEKTV